MMKIFYQDKLAKKKIAGLTNRQQQNLAPAIEAVRPIMAEVKRKGDAAIKKYTLKFDKFKLSSMGIDEEEIETAGKSISPETRKAIRLAARNIEVFHRSQCIKEQPITTMPGITCSRQSRAIERVGLYIPGGSAPLPSTVLMLGIPAKIAGCAEVVLCSPPPISAEILFAAKICNIHRIYQVGGAQAIAAMAYGCKSMAPVYKIFGPGNSYVTAAKLLASLDGISIDLPAGPSDVLVIADEQASPAFVASDLLAQAEHGEDSQVALLCLSRKFAKRVKGEIKRQVASLPRRQVIARAMQSSFIMVCRDIDSAIDFSNLFAPEHLSLNITNARGYLKRICNAGSVFIGAHSPVAAGDYASGTNHTLPTYGMARSCSGVSVDSFLKKITFQQLSPRGAKNIAPVVETLARCEGLQAHELAMALRRK